MTTFTARAYPPQVDSMLKAVTTTPDSLKAALYNEISWALRYSEPSAALRYANVATGIASEHKQLDVEANAYSIMGICKKNIGEYVEAVEFYEKALSLREQLNDREQIAYSHINLANLYINLDDAEKAKSYIDSVGKIHEQLDNKDISAYYYLNDGRIHYMQGDYEVALDFLGKAMELRKELNAKKSSILSILRLIADVQVQTGDTASAIDNYNQLIQNSGELEKTIFPDVYNSLANIHLNRRETDLALQFATRALDFADSLKAKQKAAVICGTLGMIYYQKMDYKTAAEYLDRQIRLNDEIFSSALSSSLISAKVSAEKVQKETEVQILADERRAQFSINVALSVLVGLVAVLLVVFISHTQKTKRLNRALDDQKRILDESNKNLTSSITYARSIQQSAVTPVERVSAIFPDSMVLYEPRDIVSGDWYMVESRRGLKILVEADCTGHGVPGSLLSMMGMSALKDILNDLDHKHEPIQPTTILERMRTAVKDMLQQHSDDGMSISDGMDMTIGIIDPKTKIMKFGSAYQMAILVRNGESIKLKGDRMPIGNYVREKKFTEQEIQLQTGDAVFFMSDGIKDQTNPEMKKFKGPRLDDFLLENINLPMSQIGEKLLVTLDNWRGGSPQVDDMTMVGVRI